jgi:hypothetical protein
MDWFLGTVMMVPQAGAKCQGVLHVCKPRVLAQLIDCRCILLFVSMATHSSPADAITSASAPWCNRNEAIDNNRGPQRLLVLLFQ